ncbi:hypothetical protein ACOMHN_016268 [Nucella lapillus]
MDPHDSFIAQDSASIRGDDLANSLLNFATGPDDLDLQSLKRQKSARDPMSHRIIEKRRRDRMNNCLADLSRLIPTSYLKQGQGRIEKTEIIEMAIKHIKTLQAQVDSNQKVNFNLATVKRDTGTSIDGGGNNTQEHQGCCEEQFYKGFKECQDEALRYMVEAEAMMASDPFCVRVIDHLSSAGQRFDLSRQRGDNKKDCLMEVESQQQPMSGPSSFSGSTASTPLPSLDPMLPLLPTSGGMMMPASPVRNKQLRNLLSARALQQLEAEREAAFGMLNPSSSGGEGWSTTITSTTPLHPGMSVCSATSINMDSVVVTSGLGLGLCDNSMNGSGTSSGYMSDTSAMDRFSTSGMGEPGVNAKDSSAMNVYKFKHNITKRFSQEGKAVVAQQYDGSSSTSSREDEHPHHAFLKQRSLKNKNRYSSSSDSGPYPTSDLSVATSISSHGSVDGGGPGNRKGNNAKGPSDLTSEDGECCSRSAMPLPGFVLHPSGTHYMPMSVSYNNNIPDLFDSSRDSALGPPVFHPISIPVHFRGPVISVPGSSVHSQNSTTSNSADSASLPRDTKGVKKLQG